MPIFGALQGHVVLPHLQAKLHKLNQVSSAIGDGDVQGSLVKLEIKAEKLHIQETWCSNYHWLMWNIKRKNV